MTTSSVEDIYELTPLQRGMLLHSVHDGAADMYLGQHVYTLDGPLDADALVRAWQLVFTAHPALRTSFHWEGLDKPLQVVHRDVTPVARQHDWSGLGETEQRERLDRLLADDRAQGFDLTTPPLQRLHLIHLGPDRHGLAWSHHHLLLDGWSVPVFMNEVMERYRGLTVGGPPPPAAPPYRDYIAWLQRQDVAAAERFWTETLAGFTPAHLAPLRPADPRDGTGAVDRHTMTIAAETEQGLRAAAARHRVALSALLHAAWAVVLRRYTGSDTVSFGAVTSGRPAELPEVDRMVGLFANTLPVPVTVPEEGDLGDWLRDLQARHAEIRRYEFSPLADIKKWAGTPGQHLFESLVVLDNYALTVAAGGDGDALTGRAEVLYDKVSVPLSLIVTPQPVSELQVLVHRDRFAAGFAAELLDCLRPTLDALARADRVEEVTAAAGPVLATAPATAPAAPEAGPPTPPATPEEEAIAAIYRDILGAAEVDVEKSFFELGGDSFDAVRAIGRIEGATVAMLAANPSVRGLALALATSAADQPDAALDDEIAELERQVAERAELERLVAERADLERRLAEKRAAKEQLAQARTVVPVPRDGSLVCTFQQEAAWLVKRLDPSAAATFHIPFALRLHGELDVPALQRSLRALVERHEGLRTRFVEEEGQPRQVIDPPPPAALPLPVADIAPGEVERWALDEVRRPTDLETGPVFRTALARVTRRDHVLVLVVHHIVADGWSVRILAGELSQLYAAETGGPPARLPELPIQPADHAAWQRGWLSGAELDRQLGYWRDRLAGLPTVDFPTDRPRPADPTGAGADLARRLPDDLAATARAYARANQVSLLAVLHATLLTVLYRYTGETDLPIGSVFSGRTRAQIESLVGNFANAVVLRTNLDGDPTFTDVVRRCHDTVLEATAHQDIPFGLVVDTLQPDRVAGRSPLYQIAITLQPKGTAIGSPSLGEVTTELLDVTGDYVPTDINFVIYEGTDGSMEVLVEYATELSDPDRIDRLLDHYVNALANGLAAPERPATGIEILPAAERHRLLRTWNDTAVARPAEPLHRMVEAAVAAAPDAVAVVDHDGTAHTYRELDAAANRLAHRLRRDGVGPGAPVGICLRRGADLVTALLATWKAGGGYVPLDPDLPADRLALVLADAAPATLVTHAAYAPAFPTAIRLDTEREALAAEPATAPDGGAALDDLAYLIHTSGSTGTPKGVRVSHRAIHNRIAWMQEAYGLRPDDRVLQKTPYSFDVSVWEFFWPLVTGATIVVAAPGGHGDPGYLHRLIASQAVTTVHFVPTVLNGFLDAAEGPLPSLRRVFCSGEALSAGTARRVLALWPGAELHNLYGPTEASVDVTAWRCEPDAPTVPIGRPIANTRAYVLDSRQRLMPIGVPGQLFVAGTGLADGYHNRPGLTAQSFVADPYAGEPGQRMYATGDLARWRSDGALEFLGRRDRQVKLRGQRIELAEVEHVLVGHPGVRQCTVVVRDGDHLAAYVVGDAELGEIRRYAAERLPTYMTPTAWVSLPELPTTPSGKLDTARLPEPPRPAADHVPPRTDTERWLAETWQDLLGVDRVGASDDFFGLGANSLHATQLTARIRDHLHIELAPHHLFISSGLDQLAALLDESEATPPEAPIAPVPRDGALLCTYQQESLWLVQQLDPASTAYHIGFGTRLHGELDVPALERALHALVVRHEALRTRFVAQDGLPRQVVDPPPAVSALPVTEVPADEVERWSTGEIRRPLDLAAGPMFRTALGRVGPQEHVLVVVVHHIVSDGLSARILIEELSRLYAAETTGAEAHLPDLPIQPADHAAWQRDRLSGAELDRQLDHWRERLADLPTVDFPTDRPRPAQPTGDGATVWRRLPDELAATARAYARANQVSFLAVLHAALLPVLHRYTGQSDLPIGSVFSGRTRAELEPLVGYFVNAVVLRTGLDGEPTFADLVRRCHDTVLDATAHQDVPFGLIVDTLQPDRTAGRNPLFQIALSLLPAQGAGDGPRLGDLTAEPVDATTGHARFDVAINVDDAPGGGLDLSVEYSTELFDRDRVERLIDHYTTALAHGLAEPGRPAADIEIMTAAERRQILHAWNPAPPDPVADAVAGPGPGGA
ncbi:amino acid adenylation domain-containing protein [Phytohabitans kaempferiae]|uniref:Amino acid adenylation domain-containing protein n=1 Tax=Phytohabitans kaempferiae TaxID=1620943 RepID=A0ABV6LYQ7_9ACTN